MGGLARCARKKDFWQARLHLILTYHVIFGFKQKPKTKRPKIQVSGAGGLAALAKKDFWQARLHLILTYHVIFGFKQKPKTKGPKIQTQ